ncbi:Protein phosphatase 2C containing protein [Aphelenchoides avenae]|nr:Protein phosphatase 2C containing protein [Aphelenchus avenae]
MGAYLSTPVTEKDHDEGENAWLKYASTSMQGWRVSQEDAHNCIADFTENCAIFAVYDGHGGSEVSQYAAENLPAILLKNEHFKKGEIETALTECFIEFDKCLLTEDVKQILKSLKEQNEGKEKPIRVRKETDEEEESELWEEVQALSKEANVSVDKIVREYIKVNKRIHDHYGIAYEKENTFERIVKRRRVEEDPDEEVADDSNNAKNSEHVLNGGESKAGQEPTDTVVDGNGADHKEDENASLDDSETKSPTKKKTKKRVESSPKEEKPKAANGDHASDLEDPAAAGNGASDENGSKTNGDATEEHDEGPSSTNQGGEEAEASDEEDEDEDYEEEEESESSAEESDEEEEMDISGALGDGVPGVDSGTTACVALLYKDRVVVANVGDSRAVLSRGGTAVDLSVDHKPEDALEKARVEAAGGHVSEDGRVNGGLNLSRALGDHCYKTNAELPVEAQLISPVPDIKVEQITDDDTLLVVACDGIW